MGRNVIRRHSRVTTDLPEEVRREVDRLLLEPSITYEDIGAYLQGKGFDISKSAIGRYGQQFHAAYQQLRIVEDQARALVSDVGEGLVLEEAASKLFAQEIVRLLISRDIDIQKIPRLVSDFAKLQSSSIQRERIKNDFAQKVEQTASQVVETVKANGLSDAAAAEIRKKILGIV